MTLIRTLTTILSLALLATAPALISACHDDTETPTAEGSVGLRIIVGAHTLNSLNWTITRPGQSDLFGVLDTSDHSQTLFSIPAIPVGTGYVLRLETDDTDTSLTLSCAGETAPFDIIANDATQVELVLVCEVLPDTDTTDTTDTSTDTETSTETTDTGTPEGNVDVQVDVNVRPVIESVNAPASALMGETVALEVVATDADPDAVLTYDWQSDAGALPPFAISAYTCNVLGSHPITVTVSDGSLTASRDLIITCI